MMKTSSRRLCVALLSFLGLVGVVGCQQDNEAAIKNQAGTEPLPANRPPAPKSQQEAYQAVGGRVKAGGLSRAEMIDPPRPLTGPPSSRQIFASFRRNGSFRLHPS